MNNGGIYGGDRRPDALRAAALKGATSAGFRADPIPTAFVQQARCTALQHGPSQGEMVVGQTRVTTTQRRLNGVQCCFDAAAKAMEFHSQRQYHRLGRIDGRVADSIVGIEDPHNNDLAEAGVDVSVGKQMELESGNAIQYRTCSWQKVRWPLSPTLFLVFREWGKVEVKCNLI